jgi:membrane protease YdiL (CAAX protease family)
VITVLAILSQYFVPPLVPAAAWLYEGVVTGYLIVYGIPIVAFAVLVGSGPLRRWRADLGRSAMPALGWYGAMSSIGIIVVFALLIVYEALDPGALTLLNKPNPIITSASSDPWLWIGLSFVIGAIEETIFRGWIFGFWVHRRSTSLWVHAVWTSALFAGLHLYYGATYLAAAPLIYPELFFLGLAFALAVRSSRGNLVWVALLHGATDAISFYSIINTDAAAVLHYLLIGIGALVALYLYFRSRPDRPPEPYPTVGGYPGAPMWAPNPYGPPPAVPVLPPPPPPPPPTGPPG